MCKIFAINVISHASKTNQQFVYLLNIMYIYVVAKLLTFLCLCVCVHVCVCFEFSTWVLNFAWLCSRVFNFAIYLQSRKTQN